ncbi:2-oxo-4-hydroxy-4-carboxy-5-ureidoimidazoline decarboxylase [Arthrobacter sp. U41]|uniref:2-oxo-4-hydroxy-4-carboxy-5-ureidoimidazoline decarboxylase n=1 Tax=Arthrobacter sp. U41 TaxID=1849032 RepID=UPI000859456C|nr:2-oxo-4-hydroxy-4-carboxy-5-ureidoimidazoline decarboxylase [Arthrobacter sp. U41]AOT02608.1 OHCU decarboxylase [Arthrobacter sp. U41]
MDLEQFNAAGRAEAAGSLRPCLDIQRWIDELIDARPYASLNALLEAGRSAADPFTPAEIEAALARHPRIGEQAQGSSTEAGLSQSEQAGLGEADAAMAAALADGNRVYEEKFGQVFLIRAAGRSRGEVLAALHTRLTHTPEEEQAIIGQQLREIAVLRLERLMGR